MRKRIRIMLLLCVSLLLTTACSKESLRNCIVHEWPEKETSEIILNLKFDEDLPLYKEITVDTKAASTRATTKVNSDLYDLRRIIKIYLKSEDGTISEQADATYIFYEDDIKELNGSYPVDLHGGDYHIVVWNDLVADGSGTDLYYKAGGFKNITIDPERYEGRTDARDAFRGYLDVHVEEDSFDSRTYTYDVPMQRPMAKFQFITTELNEFLEKYDTDIDLSKFNIVFFYTSFLPSEYNIFTDKPVDAMTGMTFSAKLEDLGNGEASLGFDYVFVNGSEATVQVAMGFFDEDGNILSSVPTVNVPLKRSHLTVVKGRFLTSGTDSGVGIDPNYDGDYNIEIR